jgi:hypothetical protein
MANTGSGRTQADKERSKQMSRAVAGNQGGKANARQGNNRVQQRPGGPRRSDGGRGGRPPEGRRPANGQRPPSPRRPPRRSPTALLTWGTAAVVVIIVVVLVVVKITGGNPTLSSGKGWSPASPQVVAEVTNVPASVFDAVGVNAQVSEINPPIAISGQKPLTFVSADGKTLPGVYFYGAEYCPYCGAARWSMIAALSRFGTFHKLGNMTSSSTDVDPNTPTFTFSKATYTSPYIVFKPDEFESNQVDAAGTGYTVLMKPTKFEQALVNKYDSTTYFPSLPSDENGFPFIDFGNKFLQDTLYDPSILQGVTRDQVASGLKDAQNPITQVIVAGANYLSAAICAIDGQAPAAVCTSKGVKAADKALKIG